MHNTYTEEDILRYIYKETSEQETVEILQAMESSQALKDFYFETLCMLDSLDSVHHEPDETIVRIISEESRSSSLEIH